MDVTEQERPAVSPALDFLAGTVAGSSLLPLSSFYPEDMLIPDFPQA
jgi:hypothetical protein